MAEFNNYQFSYHSITLYGYTTVTLDRWIMKGNMAACWTPAWLCKSQKKLTWEDRGGVQHLQPSSDLQRRPVPGGFCLIHHLWHVNNGGLWWTWGLLLCPDKSTWFSYSVIFLVQNMFILITCGCWTVCTVLCFGSLQLPHDSLYRWVWTRDLSPVIVYGCVTCIMSPIQQGQYLSDKQNIPFQ